MDTVYKGHSTFNLSIMDKLCGPYSIILPVKKDNSKLASSKVFVEVPL